MKAFALLGKQTDPFSPPLKSQVLKIVIIFYIILTESEEKLKYIIPSISVLIFTISLLGYIQKLFSNDICSIYLYNSTIIT